MRQPRIRLDSPPIDISLAIHICFIADAALMTTEALPLRREHASLQDIAPLPSDAGLKKYGYHRCDFDPAIHFETDEILFVVTELTPTIGDDVEMDRRSGVNDIIAVTLLKAII